MASEEQSSDVPSEEHFKHTPLSPADRQVRLIQLPYSDHAEADGHLLDCEIIHADLASASAYSALSYVWGPLDNSKSILLNGKKFDVSASLWWCLHHLNRRWELRRASAKEPTMLRLFWVDQICIDQSNTMERNHQVDMMSDIYRNASLVISWLGPNPDVHATVSNIPAPRKESTMKVLSSSPVDTGRRHSDAGEVSTSRAISLEELNKIYKSTYWTRLWIIQEVGLAADSILLFGAISVEWPYLRNMLLNGGLPYSNYLMARKYVPNSLIAHYPIAEALLLFGHHDCHDPRDKVYGLMGIVKESDRIPVDYNEPAPDVFFNAMFICMEGKMTRTQEDIEAFIKLGRQMNVTGEEVAMDDVPPRISRGAMEPWLAGRKNEYALYSMFQWLCHPRAPEHVFRVGKTARPPSKSRSLFQRFRRSNVD